MPVKYDDLRNIHRKALEKYSIEDMGINGTTEHQIVKNALITLINQESLYKRWMDGELGKNIFITELQNNIERLEKDKKIFDGKQVDKYPSMVKTCQEYIEKIIGLLQKILDELKKTTHRPQKKRQNKTMNIKIKMGGPDREELQNQFQEQINDLFKDVTNDDEFKKRMDQLEDMYTPKKDILQKSKKKFYGVLDAYIQGTLTKEKALLLLQSKHQQLNEEIKDMAVKGRFIEIDYEDGKGYVPEEFMKIAGEVNYYYDITKNNIGNADIKIESFSSPAVKRVVKSIGDSLDKYFGIAEKKESQPEQETQPIEKTPSTQCNEKILKKTTNEVEVLPTLETLEKLTKGNDPVLRRWTNGKYKCTSLRRFIKAYVKIADNLTPALIRDYLISERTKKSYTDNSIEKELTLHGPGRK